MVRPTSPLTVRERVAYGAARAIAALPPRAQVGLAGGTPIEVDGQRLEPEVQLVLSLIERQGQLQLDTLPLDHLRSVIRRQSRGIGGATVEVGAVRDLEVDGADGPLKARLYSPDEAGGPHPLVVFFHGGGFVLGDLDTHDNPCRLLCRHSGAHVMAVDYRLAPEHPYPAPTDDGWAALRWAAANAEALGADPARLAVCGDSAGGNIAAVVAQRAAREGAPRLALQVLLYPAVDNDETRPSRSLFGQGFFLTAELLAWFSDHYAGRSGMDITDPLVAPLRGIDVPGLAPALVITAAFDPLRDEGEAFAAGLRDAGVPVVLRRFGGLIHGFANMAGISRASHDAVVEIGGSARALLALGP